MANSLSGLYQTIYAAFNVVSRELIGMIPAVSKDAQAEQVTLNQPIRSPVVPAPTVSDIAPANISMAGEDMNVEYVDVNITKQRKVSFHMTAEEERGLAAGGTMSDITMQRFVQSFRGLGNEIETDLTALFRKAPLAYGSAGSAPFATADDLTELSNIGKILDDAGAPATGRSIILNTAALANLQGKQPSVFRVNENGDPMGRRMGAIGMLLNFDIGVSGQLPFVEPSAFAAAISDASGEPRGETTLAVDGVGGSETLALDNFVTVAGTGSYAYRVAADVAGSATAIMLAEPGLQAAALDNAAVAAIRGYTPSLAFTRDAFHLVCRVPAVPEGGDAANDRIYVMDPHSGLVYEISVYRQYRQVTYEVGICWGVKAVNPKHSAVLLG